MRVIDNAAPDFAKLQARILAPGFPWHYARGTRENDGNTNPYLNGWVHLVYDQGKWFSQDYQLVVNQIINMMEAVAEPIETVYRVRLVLNTISDQPYLNGPHVDYFSPHKTALLYINDADGDTLIYEEQWTDKDKEPETYTVAHRIAPVANRLVLFNGLNCHTGTTPTKTARRVVLNVNYD